MFRPMTNSTLTLKFAIKTATVFVALLWIIKLLEGLSGVELYSWGVRPQATDGLKGILTAPLIHGSWNHLISNTLPLLLLGSLLIYGYPSSRWRTLTVIWLVSGLGVWLFARPNYHFGASGITHGMFFFLFIAGVLRRDSKSIALLMIAFFMYGGMLLTIFPREPGISYEYHFFGGFAGVLCALMFAHNEKKPKKKRYSWLDENGDDLPEYDDDLIGDEWQSQTLEGDSQQPLENKV